MSDLRNPQGIRPATEHSRVLVVEDSAVQRRILTTYLASQGYQVLQAPDGRRGLEIFLAEQPRIVITDLEMPELNGFQLIEEIRRQEVLYTHITVLTSVDRTESTVRAIGLGADDYLIKPFHPDEMRVRLIAAERLVRLHSQERVILLMAKLTDYRSPETGFHIERVQHYSRLLATALANRGEVVITPQFISTLYTVSSLHDIGKIAIPDEILKKPGKLTDEEFQLMQTHARIGGEILGEAYGEIGSDFLRVARDVAMHHHERWDGSGYPAGLSGDEIPLSARVVAVADVFDAISSRRAYKDAFSREACRTIIAEGRGTQFDPAVADVFLQEEEQIWQIRRTFQDEV